jgi:nucleotide-binding universal stress UspA family protein
MKNILVLTDFTIRSINAAEFAVQLAIKNKSNIILCNVLESTTSFTANSEIKWPVIENSDLRDKSLFNLSVLDRRFKKIIAESESQFKPDINFLSETGFLFEVTKRIINERSVEMVVVGSHKSSFFERLIFGSHTHILLDKINCPILLVPLNVKFKGLDKIIYASDQSFNDSKVVDYLLNLAKPFRASVWVNHISKNNEVSFGKDSMMDEILENKHQKIDSPIYFNNIKGENVKKGLINMIENDEVDIVAFVHKQYDLFAQIFHNSISKQIADKAEVPLLIMPHTFIIDIPHYTPNQLDHYLYETANRNDIR